MTSPVSSAPFHRYTLFVLISALCAALGLILTEISLRFFAVSPLLIALVSNTVGALTLLLPLALRPSVRWRGWPAADWLRLTAASLAMFAVGFIVLYEAIGYIGSGKTSVLGRLEVVFTIALAVVFLGERWTRRHWLATFLALGGAVLVNFDPDLWTLHLGLGELLTVLGSVIFAAGIVTLKPLLDRRDGQLVTGYGLLVGALLLAPFFLASLGAAASPVTISTPVEAVTPSGSPLWLVISVLVARGMLLGVSWATYNIAMPHLGASRCSVLFLTLIGFALLLQIAIDAVAPALGLHVPENLLTAFLGGLVIALAIIVLPRES